jgi:hypothetical protein
MPELDAALRAHALMSQFSNSMPLEHPSRGVRGFQLIYASANSTATVGSGGNILTLFLYYLFDLDCPRVAKKNGRIPFHQIGLGLSLPGDTRV